MSIVIAGFVLGLSLIVAVGPQTAYIIKMGVKRDHIVAIIIVCILSDVLLINAGVAGVGAIGAYFPTALDVIKYLGAAYLVYFAYTNFRDAVKPPQDAVIVTETAPETAQESGTPETGGGVAVKTRLRPKTSRTWVGPVVGALAITWLNPMAYIDVLVMLGGIANSYGPDKWLFALGALAASAVWFPFLGLGAAKLSPVLSRPQTWRVVNLAVGFLMIALTIKLLLH
ncbi:lysine transporter LysE [Corynebacterium phocae]|uniref:Lysine transporter LysE n=1 Tax=Corynebacterium phocae TaxID=161895 RepID=A0A1L7D3P7_9CORY|nr:LysE/ArgO family amino acid transporter [Corynebacterium phocae]APT92730.1 lysine transporter LysE [Corynebacterium phocae]KAA8723038.1 amino acid transporter [Corynebacterium phocae]